MLLNYLALIGIYVALYLLPLLLKKKSNMKTSYLLTGISLAIMSLNCFAHNGDQHQPTPRDIITFELSGSSDASSERKDLETNISDDNILAADEAVFWQGTETLDGTVADAACTESICPEYLIELTETGARLRVGISTPVRTNALTVEIFNPAGNLVASDETTNQFNSEALVEDPEPGLWSIRVRPSGAEKASYRLRAKLESVTPEQLRSEGEVRALYPNLRTVPPYELTFTAPINPLNGVYPPDSVNPPASVLGESLISCSADEAAPKALGGADAQVCLRLTSGPINIGEGIYDMRFRLTEDLQDGDAELNPEEAMSRIVVGPMEQALHYSDGSIEFLDAGTYSYHPTHAHFHDDFILSYYLYKVMDQDTGSMEKAGAGSKSGFCPADQLWGNWYKFEQGNEIPGGDSPGGGCFSFNNGVVGLSVGWGDVYRWQRPGQYVEFSGQGNGKYIVHAMVDEYNNVVESDETDNVSYAYIDVQGEEISILERGWGISPWDTNKVVFSGPHPSQRNINALNESVPSAPPEQISSNGGGGAMLQMLWLLLGFTVLGQYFRRRV
ncbi:MAG: hypothetical protein ACI9SK_000108 [Zhongshania sp.]|jgi:hypothetical protein